ncbi:MAG TPA: hypothetical protein VKH42_15375 [Vicinamibacterales bacterium]|nr:hypothetical protein [Vicinamibacterales bacterium]
MIERRFVAFAVGTAVFIPALLTIDRDGLVPQLAFAAITFTFLFASTYRSRVPRLQILAAILVATLGEMFLSLVWGLYGYKHFLIPLYVPPGHGIFYALAAETAEQDGIRQRERVIVPGVLVAGTLLAVINLIMRGDTWGFLWWAIVLMLIRSSGNRLMLSACFVYTMYLEWVGTAIGNWYWNPYVPFVGLHSANPPAGVGILYILLDMIVVALTVPRTQRKSTKGTEEVGVSESPTNPGAEAVA